MLSVDAVELTEELVSIESTDPGTYEEEVADRLVEIAGDRMPDCGYILRDEAAPHRPVLMFIISPADSESKSDDGDRPEELVFICHMDTVPVGRGWTKAPFAADVIDGRIYGRGACDMKSGLAAAFSTFINKAQEFKESGKSPDRTLKFIATCDEEADMAGAARVLELGWVGSDSLVMDCEPTDGQAQTAHKGRLWYEIRTLGRAAHASRPRDGIDAIAGMAYIIASARARVSRLEKDDFLGENTIVFGRIEGGTQLYQVPGECRVSVDIRAVPPYTADDMKRLLDDACEDAAGKIPGLRYTVVPVAQRPPVAHHDDSRMLSLLQKAALRALGHSVDVGPFPGYTDTAVIASQTGNRNCLSYGPGSLEMAHKADEYVEISDIERCAAVYKELIEEWV